ncbi:c-5 sterol desaturase [Hanseniaspora osmophila]|uniref:Delta(7)-sterol 5(6)-desaturase n=1 Tax=Hanseniaspora osmophila TaxID=56408 RepID=A0A1E5RF34_9ASCO|nr:Delta(7)-sterol 5(6)-desaturase [Hanseniaspora osmophila]
MDLVLEFCDSFGFDKLYSKVFPASMAENFSPEWQSRLGLNCGNIFNSTLLQMTGNIYKTDRSQWTVNPEIYGHVPYLFNMSPQTFETMLPRYNILRQILSLFVVTTIFGWALYLICATFSYVFIFDKAVFNHPRYLKNQMSLEIKLAMSAIPGMVLLTIPWFIMELHGYSCLYMEIDYKNHGIKNFIMEYVYFILFTDCGIYLAHRWLHWPKVYKALHKPHHKWLVTTPYASHAFHPVDGYFQSLAYHVYPMLFPLHKVSYLILFTFVNFWTVMIHDGEYLANDPVVNGAACHTVHHLYFNYNYGQFTTLWDRLGGSYREPDQELFDKSLKKSTKTWDEQIMKMEEIKKVVEGDEDDRVYGTEEKYLKKLN